MNAVGVRMGMLRNVFNTSRWRSPETITSACAATAHSRNRLSVGSSRMASIRSETSTTQTRLGSVSVSLHSWSRSALTNRLRTSRYSWRTAAETASVNSPSRHRLTTSQQRPRHRLDTKMFVSRTTLRFGTVGSSVRNQAGGVLGIDTGSLGCAACARPEGVEPLRKLLMRDLEPLDQLPQDLSIFELLQPDLRRRHRALLVFQAYHGECGESRLRTLSSAFCLRAATMDYGLSTMD